MAAMKTRVCKECNGFGIVDVPYGNGGTTETGPLYKESMCTECEGRGHEQATCMICGDVLFDDDDDLYCKECFIEVQADEDGDYGDDDDDDDR
jgi:hypothetical protein